MQNGIDEVKQLPGLQSVASATVTPASSSRRASGYGERVENSTPGSRVATVVAAGQRVDVGVGQVGAVVGAGGAQLDRELHAGPGGQLVGVHPQPQPGGAARRSSTARASSPSKACADAGSQKTSTQRACGAQAASISPVTSATYSSRRSAYSGGTTCAPRNVVSGVTSRGQPQRAGLVARRSARSRS